METHKRKQVNYIHLLSTVLTLKLAESSQSLHTVLSVHFNLFTGKTGKPKVEHLYSALHGPQTTLKRSGMDHTVQPAKNTMPAFIS